MIAQGSNLKVWAAGSRIQALERLGLGIRFAKLLVVEHPSPNPNGNQSNATVTAWRRTPRPRTHHNNSCLDPTVNLKL